MRQTIQKFSNRLSTFLSFALGAAKHRADHQTLTRHIVAIHQHRSTRKIINEAALCIKDMVDYRLFAFVIKKDQNVDVWLDPRIYKHSLETVILKDFNVGDKKNLNYLNHHFYDGEPVVEFRMNDLVFYELKEENFCSRIYMLPHRKIRFQQDDIVNLILQSCSSALIRQARIENLTDAAIIDPLTGCYNRRELENQLKRTIASATRYKNTMSVFMFDLDHFKSVNDTYGHPAGDEVLKTVAALVQKNMRSGDLLARYGGEEFIAILPETGKAKAMELADRLRKKISEQTIFFGETRIRITASFGVAELDRRADMTKIIQDADTMLYKAKLNGRNTVMPGLMKVVSGKMQNTV